MSARRNRPAKPASDGHLGAGSGVIAPTIDLHSCFDAPHEKLIGHVGCLAARARSARRAAIASPCRARRAHVRIYQSREECPGAFCAAHAPSRNVGRPYEGLMRGIVAKPGGPGTYAWQRRCVGDDEAKILYYWAPRAAFPRAIFGMIQGELR